MSNDVVLGSALRTNLLSLQRTQDGIDKIQNVLATGLKVSSALDNPQSFFAAQSLNNRASDLTRLLDGIGQSVSTIQAADKGATAVGELVNQAESLANSAIEEIAENGSAVAKATGNVDLRGITDLTDIEGIAAVDQITLSYIDKDGETLRNVNVAVEAGDSIEEFIGKINDVGQTTASSTQYGEGEVFTASLSDDGGLQIESKTGGSFRAQFDADAAANTLAAVDTAFGAALGFGGIAQNVASGAATATAGNYEFTAANTTKLTSGVFGEAAITDGFAEASDTLNSVREDVGSATSRFTFTAASAIEISVNGEEVVNTATAGDPGGTLNLATTTIQGLVDRINASEQLSASYDDTTGEFSIEAKTGDVSSIQFDVVDTGTTGAPADFDFGIKADLDNAATANSSNSENYILGAANETLAQIQDDYNSVLTQIDQLVSDSGYRGVNLLKSDELVTTFNEDRTSSLTTKGRDLTSAGLGISEGSFSTTANINSSLDEILSAKNDVRNFGNAIANSLSIVQTRESFTEDLVSELEAGADKLTVADQNEEGAKLLALQTRQQLGVTSLSLAVQSQQSVLRLF
jgi:flagellin